MSRKHFKLQTTFANPDVVDSIDDAEDAYGAHVEWSDVQEPCPKSPTNQCEYDALSNPEWCKHCGRVT